VVKIVLHQKRPRIHLRLLLDAHPKSPQLCPAGLEEWPRLLNHRQNQLAPKPLASPILRHGEIDDLRHPLRHIRRRRPNRPPQQRAVLAQLDCLHKRIPRLTLRRLRIDQNFWHAATVARAARVATVRLRIVLAAPLEVARFSTVHSDQKKSTGWKTRATFRSLWFSKGSD
jgi:hypothetical protein